jgi:hypothetical protein
MTRVTIDTATFMKLLGVREDAELYDEKGRLVGYFSPGPPRDAEGNAIIPISDEELERRSKEGGGRPLNTIWQDLSKR